jgi:predicted DNA-binding protein
MYNNIGGPLMIRTQIYITDTEQKYLNKLTERLSMTQSAIIRAAIDEYIAKKIDSTIY